MKIQNQEQWSRVQKAIVNLTIDEPFFAALLFRMTLKEDLLCPTACTNGVELRYGPEFVSKLSGGQLVTLMAHEVGHPAMGHLWRLADYPHDIANIAADHEINWILEECNERARSRNLVEPFPFPDGALKDPRFRGMAAEAIAKILTQERGDGRGKGTGDGNGDGDGGGSSGGGNNNGPIGDETFGQFEQPGITEAERHKLKQEWEVDVINAARAAKAMGRCPGAIEKLVGDIVNPKKSWKELLKEFVRATAKDDYSWSRINRRYAGAGFIMPSLHSQRVGTIVYARDTSGSMTGQEAECNAELQSVIDEVRPEKVVVIDCDADVHQVFELDDGESIHDSKGSKMKGGGGTDFRPVFDKVNDLIIAGEEVVCVLFFTDLYGTFPEHEPAYPVLWAATTNSDVPWGVAVRLNE